MKYSCDIIKDLIPLYMDEKILSDESKKIVEEHLSECADCKKYLESMKQSYEEISEEVGKIDAADEQNKLKGLKKQISKQTKKTVIATLFITASVLVGLFIYFFAPIEAGGFNRMQMDSLSKEFVRIEKYEPLEFPKATNTQQATVKILEISKNKGNIKTLYGYFFGGNYVKIHDIAYCDSGSSGPFMVDVKETKTELKIIKVYGDGFSSQSVLKAAPFRIRQKLISFPAFDQNGQNILSKKNGIKVKEVLGVPENPDLHVERKGDKYYVKSTDDKGNSKVIRSGNVKDLE